ncbi:MAG: thiamine phosphate synthase [Novosphingobium sp.]|nr:thiamine phosphate synthase [Novosphingobium sp.]
MAGCYSGAMTRLKPLPAIWLISDARNDVRLEAALASLPDHSGFVFRHYHLKEKARRARYDELLSLCRDLGHLMVLSGDADTALGWGADGVYGPAEKLDVQPGLLRLATVHDAHEVASANHAQVDGMFLSPVYPTRSHADGTCLGISNFHSIAAQAESPVIALGGMNAERARELGWPRWAGIDAFCDEANPRNPKDS